MEAGVFEATGASKPFALMTLYLALPLLKHSNFRMHENDSSEFYSELIEDRKRRISVRLSKLAYDFCPSYATLTPSFTDESNLWTMYYYF